MRRPDDFEIALRTADDTVDVIGNDERLSRGPNTTYIAAYVPVTFSWEEESELVYIGLTTEHSEEKPMGERKTIYGSSERSSPSREQYATVRIDGWEYPSGTFHTFELELDDNAWYVDYSSLKEQVEHHINS